MWPRPEGSCHPEQNWFNSPVIKVARENTSNLRWNRRSIGGWLKVDLMAPYKVVKVLYPIAKRFVVSKRGLSSLSHRKYCAGFWWGSKKEGRVLGRQSISGRQWHLCDGSREKMVTDPSPWGLPSQYRAPHTHTPPTPMGPLTHLHTHTTLNPSLHTAYTPLPRRQPKHSSN